MSKIIIELPDERMQQLHGLAKVSNMAPELLLQLCIEEWLRSRAEDHLRATQHVLKKNEELYRRLA